jgi:hypothetical protein
MERIEELVEEDLTDVWIEARDDGEATSATGVRSVMPNGEELQQVGKEKFALICNTPEEYIYRGFEERTVKQVIEQVATEFAEDEENIDMDDWKAILEFKEKLLEVFDFE